MRQTLLLISLSYFCLSSPAFSQSNQPILEGTINQEETLPPASNPQLNSHIRLIMGMWRGFHEIEETTLYYGYQFRPNGTFSARHRLYEGEKTLEDNLLQGQWTFDGQIVQITGNSSNNPEQSLKIQFRLAEDLQLYYQTGSLPDTYSLMRLGKVQ